MVAAALRLARESGFTLSCRAEQGRLLQVLAGGVGAGVIGETGTGCGVGLAWLAAGAHPEARLVSVERDPGRAKAVQALFEHDPRVEVLEADWHELAGHGPFDLLVLDGGGQGKKDEPPLDPAGWLRPGGSVVLDDFTPCAQWPPRIGGQVDTARLYWMEHPALNTTEVRVAPGASSLIGYRRPV